jgi:hypothetical protein
MHSLSVVVNRLNGDASWRCAKLGIAAAQQCGVETAFKVNIDWAGVSAVGLPIDKNACLLKGCALCELKFSPEFNDRQRHVCFGCPGGLGQQRRGITQSESQTAR